MGHQKFHTKKISLVEYNKGFLSTLYCSNKEKFDTIELRFQQLSPPDLKQKSVLKPPQEPAKQERTREGEHSPQQHSSPYMHSKPGGREQGVPMLGCSRGHFFSSKNASGVMTALTLGRTIWCTVKFSFELGLRLFPEFFPMLTAVILEFTSRSTASSGSSELT